MLDPPRAHQPDHPLASHDTPAIAERSTPLRRGSAPAAAFLLIGLVVANSVIAIAAPRQLEFQRAVQDFLWAGSGVIALVGLTAAVVGGLLATDRLFLGPRARIAFQSAHRSVAVAALGFLVAHVALQIAYGQAAVHHAAVPWGADPAVAFGTVAFDLVLLLIATGLLRRRFSGALPVLPRMWRILHAAAYLCWPLAIVHGLTAGRPPSGLVVLCYCLCLAAVGAALVARLLLTAGGSAAAVPERRVTVVAATGAAGAPPARLRRSSRLAGAWCRPARRGGPASAQGDALTEDLAFWSSLRDRR